MVSRMRRKTTTNRETDLAALLGNSGEDPEADDALAEALQLDAVAMVAVATIQ